VLVLLDNLSDSNWLGILFTPVCDPIRSGLDAVLRSGSEAMAITSALSGRSVTGSPLADRALLNTLDCESAASEALSILCADNDSCLA
jgi:hypothetical protein